MATEVNYKLFACMLFAWYSFIDKKTCYFMGIFNICLHIEMMSINFIYFEFVCTL